MHNADVRSDPEDIGLPSARVIESAVELARAESKLVLSHVKVLSLRALSAVLILLVATSLSQVAILLLALSPVLFSFRHDWPVVVSVLLPAVVAGVAVWLAVRSFKRLSAAASSHSNNSSTEPTQ